MNNPGIDFISNRKYSYILSGLMVVIAIVGLAIFGLKTGIDFAGGSVMEIEAQTTIEELDQIAASVGIDDPTINTSGDNRYLIRYQTQEDAEAKRQELAQAIEDAGYQQLRFDNVGPSVSRDVVQKAFVSIAIMSLAIIAFIAYSFREMPPPVRPSTYGLLAVVALLHDSLFVIGSFAFLGEWLGVEIDSFFVTAVLTVIAFSVHDTIVIYDRIRENLLSKSKEKFADLINRSINENLRRSLNTSAVIVLMLGALFFYGGSSIKFFVLALILGMVSGTYSSIFLAAPMLVTYHNYIETKNSKSKKKK